MRAFVPGLYKVRQWGLRDFETEYNYPIGTLLLITRATKETTALGKLNVFHIVNPSGKLVIYRTYAEQQQFLQSFELVREYEH